MGISFVWGTSGLGRRGEQGAGRVCLLPLHEAFGLQGNHELLVGGGHHGLEGGVGSGDDDLLSAAGIGLFVQVAAQGRQGSDDVGAGLVGVLADAAGEEDGVDAAQQQVVSADVVDQPVEEEVVCDGGVLVTGVAQAADVAHVAGLSGDAEESGLLVEEGVDLLGGEAALLLEEDDGGGVHISGAGSHDQAGQGGESHGGVDNLSALHRAEAGAVAQMAGDDAGGLGIQSQEFADAPVDVFMAGAVEAVFPHAVFLVVFLGDGVEIGLRLHGHVEGGVEDGHIGDAGEVLLAGLDAAQVGGVVEGAQGKALAHAGFDGLVNDAGLGELHAAVEDAVPDGLDFGEVLDDAGLAAGHLRADGRQRLAVAGDLQGFLPLLALCLVGQLGAVHANALHKALAEDGFFLHVKESELQGGTSGINDEDFQS